jgi:hypothetical protein
LLAPVRIYEPAAAAFSHRSVPERKVLCRHSTPKRVGGLRTLSFSYTGGAKFGLMQHAGGPVPVVDHVLAAGTCPNCRAAVSDQEHRFRPVLCLTAGSEMLEAAVTRS